MTSGIGVSDIEESTGLLQEFDGNKTAGELSSQFKQSEPSKKNFRAFCTFHNVVLAIIFFFMLGSALVFVFISEEEELLDLRAVSANYPLIIPISDPEFERQTVIEALCRVQITQNDTFYTFPNPTLIYITIQGSDGGVWNTLVQPWILKSEPGTEVEQSEEFYTSDFQQQYPDYRWIIGTNSEYPVGITFRYTHQWALVEYQVVIAALILIAVYILIIFELVHRTLAALLGSFLCLAAVSLLHGRPSLAVVINWIDFETVVLLFGMMIMVGIFAETGFFEWAAIKAYKLSKGNVWNLTLILCLFTAFVSAFLDNVTTILLIVPVSIRLCKVLNVAPQPMIISLVLMSNIGGTATAIGDPPNIIIVNDPDIVASGEVTFLTFSLHVAPGAIFAAVTTMLTIYALTRKSMKRMPMSLAQKEIAIWEETLKHIGSSTEEEQHVRAQLEQFINTLRLEHSTDAPQLADISELEATYVIRNVPLLISSSIVLVGVILLFFLHSWIEHWVELTMAWIAIIGAMIHLIVSGIDDLEAILEKVEFSTLLFFAGLFVLMHGLDILGLIDYIGDIVYDLISKVPEDSLGGQGRLLVAVLLLIWVSALASAFIDNIPYTTAMVPVVVSLAESDLGLPLTPLVWSLAFGTCFGGNGTLIGASANVVAVGLSEQQGHKITFVQYFKIGFPCMIVSTITATVYMVISHVVFPWY